jgi:hypothetical protein
MEKKKKELKPEVKEFNDNLVNKVTFDSNTEMIQLDNNEEISSDSYLRGVIDNLMDYNNPSTKTEYRNVEENLVGSVLAFLATETNIPSLAKFVDIFEIKRISLERKGRQELILALLERQQEIDTQKDNKLKNILLGS